MSLKKKHGSGLYRFTLVEYTMLVSASELTITPMIFWNDCTKELKCYRMTSGFIVMYSKKKGGEVEIFKCFLKECSTYIMSQPVHTCILYIYISGKNTKLTHRIEFFGVHFFLSLHSNCNVCSEL